MGRVSDRASIGPCNDVEDVPTVRLDRWAGPWADTDPDANFKSDITLYSLTDPLSTIRALAARIDVPEGAIVRYVLAKWATGGSGGLLELGPSMVHRLWAVFEEAEASGTDDGRLRAYDQLRQMISWLRLPLVSDMPYRDERGIGSQ